MDPEGIEGGEHLVFACFILNTEEGFSWQFTVFQTSTDGFYYQWSGVLWQLFCYCCAILSALGDGATVNTSKLRKEGGAGLPGPS